MFKFAHISDVHLGAFRDIALREMNLNAFLKAMDKCIENKVDFIIFAGDLFDNNMPDAKVLSIAVKKMREVKDNEIEIYVIYGSHDYSPIQASIIDVLQSAGLFIKLDKNFIEDKKTKAKIAGVSALKRGEIEEDISQVKLAGYDEKDFRIFVLHAAISDVFSDPRLEPITIGRLKYELDYIACGHVHQRAIEKIGNATIAYPGTLFGYTYQDLEATANGEKRGFFIITVDENKKIKHDFIEIKEAEIKFLEYDATGKTPSQVVEEIKYFLNDVKNKVILLKIFGKLSIGKPSDIDFSDIKEYYLEKGASIVYINRNQLIGKEETEIEIIEESRDETEKRLFEEQLKKFQFRNAKLKDVKTALELLNALKEENKGETKADYEKRMKELGIKILG
ncbi:MAG: DNA repair exonuclease [Candidatus Aenigmatarchaeota archaeon]|nr:DNA repair exonuclease [Candidatus Aenigmarchaeota archaeon]